jgi:hypothetical protein
MRKGNKLVSSRKTAEGQMKKRLKIGSAAIVVFLATLPTLSISLAQNHAISYKLLDKQTNVASYTLNIVVPQPLLDYYEEKNHIIYSSQEFPKFVTPYAVKPVGDCLLELYPEQEDFANAALMIVHQMTYVETAPGKYPAETFVDNTGDCDILSFAAASIIKSAGIDVVLLHYEEEKHMNIGVHLDNPPQDARTSVYKFTQNDIPYYIAECTGGNWTTGWRVGECPDNLKRGKAQILTLENAEQVAPGQISASFTTLEDSDLSLETSPPFAIEDNTIVLQGRLTPNIPDENVTIYLGENGHPWMVLATATTQQDGTFSYAWKTENAGLYGVRASWSGDKTYAGTTSPTRNVAVIPVLVSLLIVIAVAAVAVGTVASIASRNKNQPNLEPMEPQPPSFS